MSVHSGFKPYKCQDCDYTSIRAGDLKKHEKIHSSSSVDRESAQQFKCKFPKCNFSTMTNKNLALHLNVIHSMPRIVLQRTGLKHE